MAGENGLGMPAGDDFQSSVEKALKAELKGITKLEKPDDRHKLLNVAIKFLAIKGRLLSPLDAAGFAAGLDDDDP